MNCKIPHMAFADLHVSSQVSEEYVYLSDRAYFSAMRNSTRDVFCFGEAILYRW